jgi:hypothetical protein
LSYTRLRAALFAGSKVEKPKVNGEAAIVTYEFTHAT